jgi:hypothetical protein
MSVMTHDDFVTLSDAKKSSAQANVWAVNPSDLSKLLVAIRTDSSSSMIEITNPRFKWPILRTDGGGDTRRHH